ncbi:hypothetical protein PYW08_001475 [Mythimna loreyi]|uniref:Uncharacterized protein n=1 Tax=Mythimna loreyi TaxID=667449 RepID=A0ACC2R6Q4_9NEOP|nr:hypothetical protein PYW08_001475 [Mythimna loreyi]
MAVLLWSVVVAYILVLSQVEAARILAYFPTPSISHQVVFRPLTEALASRGHEVVVVTADPAFPEGKTPPNLTEIDVHNISYGIWIEEVMKEQRGAEDDFLAQMDTMVRSMVKVFDHQLENEKVKTLINGKHQKFDLLLLETFMLPLLAFSHIYKVPVIQVSSFGALYGNYESVGAPTHPLLYPLSIRRKLNNLTMWEKVTELYYLYKGEEVIMDIFNTAGNSLIKKHFGPEVPRIEELVNNIDMLFLNVHPLFEGIRPVPPSVVYMSGLHQKPTKELPEDLKSYLYSSKHGVIYISFGTNVDPSLLPPEKIQILIRVFSQLPYDVLWKWNKDELPGRTENIRISKWLPQSDLLKHPKVKLFITQGGLQSTDEAITAGVPLIGMPMLGDQWFNVERYEYYKIGVRLDMETMTEENLKNAITTVIGDESYRRNMERFRSLVQDAPQSPLERAVWWTEYVLRHGGAKHLRSPSANISWWEYLELDLVLTLLAAFLIALTLIIVALRCVYKLVLRNYLVVAYIFFLSRVEAARILAYFPTPSVSHQVVFRPLTEALASRGHEVTVITTDPAFPKGGTPPNLTEIDVHDLSYRIWIDEVMKAQRGKQEDDIVAPLNTMVQAMLKVFDNQLKTEEVKTLIVDKRKQSDLLLLEAFFVPALAFSHIFKVPVIQVSSFGAVYPNYESMGASAHPLLYPINSRRKLNNLTIWEKVQEFYFTYKLNKMIWSSWDTTGNTIIRKHFGPKVPQISELMNNIDMLFLNIHPLFETIRPVPPSVIYVSGLHQKPTKELPKDLKSYLDSSKHGVIYISYGTNVDTSLLPPEKIQIIIRVLSQLPYDILWKWNTDELPGRTANIRISKWLPQADLLKHPKVKLFITQGGLQSTDEAITAGVPLIGMPMLGDQWFNVERYEFHKIGVRLDMETLTEENFKNAITKTIGDDSYRRNMERFRSLVQDAPQSPLERAVWWTEYVLRHGGAKHLRSPSANITWWHYLELDLVLTLLAAFLIAITLIIVALRFVYKFVLVNYLVDVKIKGN